jgi:dynein heavy chain
MILVRHGLMVVGPTMGGKTHCLKVLQEAVSSIDKPVQSRKINPKSVTGFQLYGCLNPDTKAWTEGVIP